MFTRTILAGIAFSLVACSSAKPPVDDATAYGPSPEQPSTTTPETAADLLTTTGTPSGPAVNSSMVCAAGGKVDEATALCVSPDGKTALGPFPQGMRDACVAAGGGATCATDAWPVAVAAASRNKGAPVDPLATGLDGTELPLCPTGTDIDPRSGICADTTFVYAPFYAEDIATCKAMGGGSACDGNRFPKNFTADAIAEFEASVAAHAAYNAENGIIVEVAIETIKKLPSSCGLAAEIMNNYIDSYPKIAKAGKAFGKRNGTTRTCATFASLAMQRTDPAFPFRPRVDGVGAKEPGFREALESRQWTRVPPDKCQAGDFGFMTEAGPTPKTLPPKPKVTFANPNGAHSDHVIMITGPVDLSSSGYSVPTMDNRKESYVRGGKNLHLAYCMRAPGVAQGCAAQPDTDCGGKSDGLYCGLVGGVYNVIECQSESRGLTLQCGTSKKCTVGQRSSSADLTSAADAMCK